MRSPHPSSGCASRRGWPSKPWRGAWPGGAAGGGLTQKLESAVLTSATLSVDGRFDYLCERLGLLPADVRAENYLSTLDPARQLLALSVRDVGDPREAAFVANAAEVVAEMAGLGR